MADELTENEESVELTDEELDRIADTAISALPVSYTHLRAHET